jgi:predicted RNA binding protein YcfA (HicA-like mRNA interferase family)
MRIGDGIDPGTKTSYTLTMKGHEFLKRLRRLGKTNGVNVLYDGKPGKGSHGRIYYGAHFTTIKDPTKEIGSGLLNKMLKDLRLTKDDLQ